MFALPPLADEQSQDAIRLADWVELNLLVGEEVAISVAGIASELAGTPPDDSAHSENREQFWNEAEEQAEGAFAELAQRATWLNSSYPLEIRGEVALLKAEALSQESYSFLVLLRARQMYDDTLGDDGKESGLLFEELAGHAFGEYAGVGLRERVRFGVAGGQRGGGLPSDLAEALEELSRRMNEEVGGGSQPTVPEGDLGLDAVAWKPFGDKRPGQIVLLGQATISEGKWMRKEVPARWTDRKPPENRPINFLGRPLTAVAFAETLSLTPTEILAGLSSSFSSIPFDRLRLLSVLSDDALPQALRQRMNGWVERAREGLPA